MRLDWIGLPNRMSRGAAASGSLWPGCSILNPVRPGHPLHPIRARSQAGSFPFSEFLVIDNFFSNLQQTDDSDATTRWCEMQSPQRSVGFTAAIYTL